mmetsp:Transcript_20699/g.53027  ORF Transcript_20699/g.53027 Transcript_20699/m.53027 type:complete len:212 (+) Transcript_20699:183-818(+)
MSRHPRDVVLWKTCLSACILSWAAWGLGHVLDIHDLLPGMDGLRGIVEKGFSHPPSATPIQDPAQAVVPLKLTYIRPEQIHLLATGEAESLSIPAVPVGAVLLVKVVPAVGGLQHPAALTRSTQLKLRAAVVLGCHQHMAVVCSARANLRHGCGVRVWLPVHLPPALSLDDSHWDVVHDARHPELVVLAALLYADRAGWTGCGLVCSEKLP